MTDDNAIAINVTKVTGLSEADVAEMDRRREWVFKYPGFFGDRSTPKARLQLIDTILKDKKAVESGPFMLQSLGIILGDAIAVEKGVLWYMMETSIGRGPGLGVEGTSLTILPVPVIGDRIAAGEAVDVYALFDYFCSALDEMKRNDAASRAS